MVYYRSAVVDKANSWLGLKSTNKSNKIILDTYNKAGILPRGYIVKETDNWCATFASAVFIAIGYKDIFPIECSCGQMIKLAKSMGIWVENDAYVPEIGDCMLYDWDDTGKGDDTGWPDHIGIVTYVNKKSGYIEVTEGNYQKSVKKRTVNINGRYIRGYIAPKFDATYDFDVEEPELGERDINTIVHEVIIGKWGSGDLRRRKLAAAGYDYNQIQNEVNRILNTRSKATVKAEYTRKVVSPVRPQGVDSAIVGNYETTANLHIREGAGTNKKTMKLMPKGTIVKCSGSYTLSNGQRWYYITTAPINGVVYTGFSCSKYLVRR